MSTTTPCWVCGTATTNTETGVCEECAAPLEVKPIVSETKRTSINTVRWICVCGRVNALCASRISGYHVPCEQCGETYFVKSSLYAALETERDEARAENQRLREALETQILPVLRCEAQRPAKDRIKSLRQQLRTVHRHLKAANRGAEINAKINWKQAGVINDLRAENKNLLERLENLTP